MANQSRPTRRQRPPRRPDVERRDMPVPDVLLMDRVQGSLLERERDFDEAGPIGHHSLSPSLGFEPNFSTGVLDSAEQVVAGGERVSDVLARRLVNAPRTRRDLQSVKTVQVGDKITTDG